MRFATMALPAGDGRDAATAPISVPKNVDDLTEDLEQALNRP